MSELFWTRDATLSGNECFRLGTRVWNTDGSCYFFTKVQIQRLRVRNYFMFGTRQGNIIVGSDNVNIFSLFPLK